MEFIFEKGLVLSQFPPGTKNVKQNFIKRNELVAMLAKKIVVIQAGKDSGALYTAKCGMKYNKEVFAVPNNIYDNFSLGTNELILQGANIYETLLDMELKGYIKQKRGTFIVTIS